ncbi:DNA repair protein-like protein rad50 [Delitschia confertaspora ATCC 74209]|uniref:DNA repair protein RAD50 n=1 Tax=Delitschia confertaspora ATCC 74209 TaxID=1513339 RepID=A0A9P4JS21_9PLEO|nr:DNA repair protein-like protein rad50 [Delitschia confertaspora ATCC 74209]
MTSKIDKLSILGVRSFDNIRSETIQFNTPLTLIVGYNGSGKTTIIECLKYATTGELPPNSKTGGAFIHDPKLCGEKEVLAQVKLSFKSTSGARMVATRSLQLTVKKTTRSQKTLEGQLLMIKDGERTAISSRVAELDQILPQYLGVSKAVLENVIFCHQDDSLWPMSEPGVLKKKFDEIFEALKYTKAIENIKILRKKQNEELGKLKLIEQHAKEDKEKGDRTEKRSTELYDEIEAMRAQLEEIQVQSEEARKRAEDAFNHAARFEQTIAQLNGKRTELTFAQKSVSELQDTLREMAEGDDELKSILDQYEERVAVYQEQKATLLEQIGTLKEELETNRRGLGSKQTEIGTFEAQKAQHERQVQQRENLVRDTAKRHGVRGFDFDVSNDKIAEFKEIIGKMSRDQNRSLDRARLETREEIRKVQDTLNQLNERKSALNQSKEWARSQISTNEQQIATFQTKMDRIDIDEGGEAVLVEKKEDTEKRLRKTRADYDNANLDGQIREAEVQLRTLDEKKEGLDEELGEATRFARDTAQIEYRQGQLKETKHKLETMIGAHGTRITEVVASEWEPASLEPAFERMLSRKASAVREAETIRDVSSSKLDQITYQISREEESREKKCKEVKEAEKIVQEAVGEDADPSEFEDILGGYEEEYDLAHTDVAKFQVVFDFYRECYETGKKHNICRLCERTLRDDKQDDFTVKGFFERVQRNIDRNKKGMEQRGSEVTLAELEQLRNAKTSYEIWTRLRDHEIPEIQTQLAKLASERESANQELEEQDSVIQELQSSKQDVESLSKIVQSIVNYHNDARRLEREIQDMAEKQKAAGMSRSIEAIQEDSRKVNEEIRTAKASLTRLQGDRERAKNQINGLELRVRDLIADLSNAQSQLKEKRDLAGRIDELKSRNNEQREATRGFDRDIQTLVPQIEQAQLKLDDTTRRGNERVERLQDDVSKFADSVRQLTSIEQDINAYIDRGGPQQLARAHREMENLQGEIDRTETEINQATKQYKKVEDTLRDTDDTKRSINDNLRYRRAKRDVDKLKGEIEELAARNAEADKERYEEEGAQFQHTWNKLKAQENTLCGVLGTKDEQLKELIQEWESEYRNAAYKFREAHIKVETTKAAVEDLGRYGGALDKAIMKYHTLKMEEINRIVEELWKKTYQGTDIDTIMIRSDNETAKGNRSYNYRVVMCKQDAEMDMRGRCSAGQKVLASIIIRLALAECFGVNCGLIALDEPTTNLDSNNIVALASSLAEIIKIRRKQANFQLIVITHDEEFLKNMQCAEFTDTYYRIMRNEKQKSIIERQSIHEVSR